MNQGQQVNNR